MKDYMNEYSRWLACTAEDEKTNSELRSIGNDAKEIEERFYTELEFGTAGLRGIIKTLFEGVCGRNRLHTCRLRHQMLSLFHASQRAAAILHHSRKELHGRHRDYSKP